MKKESIWLKTLPKFPPWLVLRFWRPSLPFPSISPIFLKHKSQISLSLLLWNFMFLLISIVKINRFSSSSFAAHQCRSRIPIPAPLEDITSTRISVKPVAIVSLSSLFLLAFSFNNAFLLSNCLNTWSLESFHRLLMH